MTLYLHIGYGKTATTTIQTFFSRNAEKLREEGVFWAGQLWHERDTQTGMALDTKYGTVAMPWYIANEVIHELSDKALPGIFPFYQNILDTVDIKIDDFLQNLALQQDTYPHIVLSSEDFTGCPYILFFPEVLSKNDFVDLRSRFIQRCKERLADFDDIKIIVGVRRQDKFLESGYNQVVSSELCYRGTMEEYIALHTEALYYDDNINAWAEHFGQKNIVVMPFEKSAMNNDPLQSFLDAIDCKIDASHYAAANLHANYSASVGVLSDKLYYNRFLKDTFAQPTHMHIQQYFDQTIETAKNSSMALLSAVQRQQLLKNFEASNNNTAAQFLSKERLFNEAVGNDDPNAPFIHDKNLPRKRGSVLKNALDLYAPSFLKKWLKKNLPGPALKILRLIKRAVR